MRIHLLDIPIDRIGMNETLKKIDTFISTGRPHLVVTPNVDHIVTAHLDDEFLQIYKSAALSVVDGVPLLWAARFLGTPLVERVNGTDLFILICERASQKAYRIFLLGAVPGVASSAAINLKHSYPGLKIVGTYSPPFDFIGNERENKKIIGLIQDAKPDVLFVGLGSPKQEKWSFRYLDVLKVPVVVGIGASFDYVAETVRRAPKWMQRNGFEWLFRILYQPKRYLARYLMRDLMFLILILWEKLRLMVKDLLKRESLPKPG